MEKRELVIIGAGPAGLTSAIYGRRAGLDVLLLEKGIPGGQINITDEIENWPGTIHSSGSDLGKTSGIMPNTSKPNSGTVQLPGSRSATEARSS